MRLGCAAAASPLSGGGAARVTVRRKRGATDGAFEGTAAPAGAVVWFFSAIGLIHHCLRTARRLDHVDTRGEFVLQLVNMGNDQDLLEVILDRADRLHQALSPLRVMGAEALVDDQRLQLGPRPVGQQPAEGDAHREVDAESLAAAEHLVLTGHPGAIADLYVKCLNDAVFAARL